MQVISMYLLPIVLILIVIILSIIIGRVIHLSSAYRRRENDYKTSMITAINEKAEDDEPYFESINNIYTEYSSRARKKELTLDVFTLNTKLTHELRNNNYIKYYKDILLDNGKIANEVEEINKHLHERLRNDDEVLIGILCKIDELPVDEQIRAALDMFKGEVLSYINAIIATCDGRMIEKEITLAQTELKLKKVKRSRIITYLIGTIGITSGLITIYNNFIVR